MTFYHGSPCVFDAVDLDEQTDISAATQFTEGRGFYFSDSLEVAKNYGPNIYRLDIPKEFIGDFRQKKEIETALRHMLHSARLSQDFLSSDILEQLITSILNCDIAVSSLPHALALLLENDYELYLSLNACYKGDDLADDFQEGFLRLYPFYIYPVREPNGVTYGKVARNCSAIQIEKLISTDQIPMKGRTV